MNLRLIKPLTFLNRHGQPTLNTEEIRMVRGVESTCNGQLRFKIDLPGGGHALVAETDCYILEDGIDHSL